MQHSIPPACVCECLCVCVHLCVCVRACACAHVWMYQCICFNACMKLANIGTLCQRYQIFLIKHIFEIARY